MKKQIKKKKIFYIAIDRPVGAKWAINYLTRDYRTRYTEYHEDRSSAEKSLARLVSKGATEMLIFPVGKVERVTNKLVYKSL